MQNKVLDLALHCWLNGMLIQDEMKKQTYLVGCQVFFFSSFSFRFDNGLFQLTRVVNAIDILGLNNIYAFEPLNFILLLI